MSDVPLPLITLFLALIYVVYRNMSRSQQVTTTGEAAKQRKGCSGNILFILLLTFPVMILILGITGLANDPSGEYQSTNLIALLLGLISPVFLVYRLWQAFQLRQAGVGLGEALRAALRLDYSP